jgi:hypothetical protein
LLVVGFAAVSLDGTMRGRIVQGRGQQQRELGSGSGQIFPQSRNGSPIALVDLHPARTFQVNSDHAKHN